MSLKENPDVNSSMDLGEEYPKRAMEVRGDESGNKVQFWKKSKSLGIPQYMMMVYAGPDSISLKNAMLLKEQQQTNKCPKCGNPNQDSANYCTNCGNKLKD